MIRTTIENHFALFISIAALATSFAPASALAGDAAAGKTVYTANCVSCHGETGKGDGPVGQVLQPPPRDFATADFMLDGDGDGKPGSDADLKAVITKGAGSFKFVDKDGKEVSGNQMMAAWGGVLSDEDIDNVVAYIRTLKQ
jgi:mono/diheme cytochrome c family protein